MNKPKTPLNEDRTPRDYVPFDGMDKAQMLSFRARPSVISAFKSMRGGMSMNRFFTELVEAEAERRGITTGKAPSAEDEAT